MAEVIVRRAMLHLLKADGIDREKQSQLRSDLASARPIVLASSTGSNRIRGHVKWKLVVLLQVSSLWEKHDYNDADDFLDKILTSEDAEDKTEVKNSLEKGRHIVATQPIEAGQVVLHDPRPLACIIFDAEEGLKDIVYCTHCAKATICPWTSPRCPDVLFCSTRCARLALTSYHEHECAMRLYAVIKALSRGLESMSVGKLLALRILTLRCKKWHISNLSDMKYVVSKSGITAKNSSPFLILDLWPFS